MQCMDRDLYVYMNGGGGRKIELGTARKKTIMPIINQLSLSAEANLCSNPRAHISCSSSLGSSLATRVRAALVISESACLVFSKSSSEVTKTVPSMCLFCWLVVVIVCCVER